MLLIAIQCNGYLGEYFSLDSYVFFIHCMPSQVLQFCPQDNQKNANRSN